MAKRILTKSLSTVVQRMFENDRFQKSLKKDPEEGLKEAGIRLSRRDMRKLKSFLRMPSMERDLKTYKRIGYRFQRKLGILPW